MSCFDGNAAGCDVVIHIIARIINEQSRWSACKKMCMSTSRRIYLLYPFYAPMHSARNPASPTRKILPSLYTEWPKKRDENPPLKNSMWTTVYLTGRRRYRCNLRLWSLHSTDFRLSFMVTRRVRFVAMCIYNVQLRRCDIRVSVWEFRAVPFTVHSEARGLQGPSSS